MNRLDLVEKPRLRDDVPDFRPGDTVKVHVRVVEGTRERIDWDLPDLFVVDGGRGQLNVALAAARDLGLHELPIVGLAKEKTIPGYPARMKEEGDGEWSPLASTSTSGW